MSRNKQTVRRQFVELLIVGAGIIFGQAVLYGPSLIGEKVLLPLDVLTQPGIYIPQNPETVKIVPHDIIFNDLVTQFEPARQFAVSEIHQGRFPIWASYQYGGVPFVWPKYSLFLLLECCTRSPVILVWVQLFGALVGGAGMYFFCRKSLQVSFWPATVCAWCYPLTAFFIFWHSFPTSLAVYWLPWIFLCVDKTVREARPLGGIGLSIATFLVLTSGQLDIAGQVLLGSGIYSIWCLWDAYPGEWFRQKFRTAVVMLALGWGLGFLLAAPHLLPLLEYAQTGSRMMHRSAGAEERPPVGLAALPQVVLPDIYGTTMAGSYFIGPHESNLLESASAAYIGIFATLLVAPLAWCNRRHHSINIFWVLLAFCGLTWCLNVPVFVQLLRWPGLNMMSHNRLVFLTSFAMLALTAFGLENLLHGQVERRWWFGLPAALLAGLFGWCIYRSYVLPEPIATQLEQDVLRGLGQFDLKEVRQIQAWFIQHYTIMAELCGLCFVGWLLLWFQKTGWFRLFPVLVILLLGDLLWFDYGRNVQCDPALYYPRIPILAKVAQSVPGRVIGVRCLHASFAMTQGLNDIRGYDAIDPARMVALLKTAAEPGTTFLYAATQFLTPKGTVVPPSTIHFMPVLDLLDVRYAIFRGEPPPRVYPAFQGDDYWVLINSNALPRPFVPKSVQTIATDNDTLEKMSSPQFDPAEVAYVASPVALPAVCRGTGQIIHEIPTRILISAQMETPGLIVLADNWDQGWRAYWNGRPVPVLRTDYTLRGVVVPAGAGTLELVYQPASFMLALWLAGFAASVLAVWLVVIQIGRAKTKAQPVA